MFYKKKYCPVNLTYNTTVENMLKKVHKTLRGEEPFLIKYSQHSLELFCYLQQQLFVREIYLDYKF